MVKKSASGKTKKNTSKRKQKSSFISRPPIVTMMGHVDHGKTSLLDVIRKTQLQAKEVGGITQSIGAYQVDFNGDKVTFIDTPGHEAFTSMRARGGQAADLVVLVVAANDGVMPQTIEAINHAKAAGVPTLVAINKMDLPSASAQKVKSQLAQNGVLVEEHGGDVVAVEVSARTRQGITELLEMIMLLSEMQELKADLKAKAQGFVIESRKEKKRGVVSTFIIQEGILKVADFLLVGESFGKVKAMFDWQAQALSKADPGTPVEVLGLREATTAGVQFKVVKNEDEARELIGEKPIKATFSVKGALGNKAEISGPELHKIHELALIVKADSLGSLEAVHHSLEKIQTEGVSVRFIHEGVGPITETDVMLAVTANALVLGFRVGVDPAAQAAAEFEDVFYKTYDIIYHLLEEVEDVILGEEEAKKVKILGQAEIVKIFELSDKTKIAGCKVTEGVIKKGNKVNLVRGEEQMAESVVSSLRQGKENVPQVKKGSECGIGLKGEVEVKEGDEIIAVAN